MKNKICTIIYLIIFPFTIFCTNISGGIYTNTTLTKSNSPYIVTGNVVVFPDKILTIEPGVELKFDNNITLEIRGTLIAKGTSADTIRFTSNTGTTKSSWGGIAIKNTQGGNAFIKHCKFTYASSAINEECCNGSGRDTVLNSAFISNFNALSGYTGNNFIVDSCLFQYNTNTITEADKFITNSIFEYNTYGLSSTERVNVSNSIFKNNQTALHGARGVISNCTIENNKVGINSTYEGFRITKSSISNNDTGIIVGWYNQGMAKIDSSKICHNTFYNFINIGMKNLDIYTNCFCNKDSTIVENKIYDGYDNNSYGLVSYDILNSTCDTFIKKEDKNASRLIHWVKAKSPYILTQNFVLFPNWTLLIDPGVEVRFDNNIQLEIRGTLIAKGTSADTIRFTSNTGMTKSSWGGIAIRNTQGGNAFFKHCKFTYSSSAINEECCNGSGRDTVLNSVFISNYNALSGYTGNNKFLVDSCLFKYNTNTITEADKFITNSIFEYNTNGLSSTERVYVSNSIFKNNHTALLGARGDVSGCTIENNKVGINSTYEGFRVTKSSISNNDTGIIVGWYNQGMAKIDSSKICHNTFYNFINLGNKNVEIYTNCFCNKDSAIVENKIYDGYDNITKGLVDYDLYTNNCDTLLFRTHKLTRSVTYYNTSSSIYNLNNLDISIYPNPVVDILKIETQIKNFSISIYNVIGQIIYKSKNQLQINLENIKNGIYLIEINNAEGESIYKSKITISH